MKERDTICNFLDRTGKDARIGPLHIALYFAIVKCWHEQGKECSTEIISRELMALAKICSSATYHKTIRQLNEFGYIKYIRANSRWERSKVSF